MVNYTHVHFVRPSDISIVPTITKVVYGNGDMIMIFILCFLIVASTANWTASLRTFEATATLAYVVAWPLAAFWSTELPPGATPVDELHSVLNELWIFLICSPMSSILWFISLTWIVQIWYVGCWIGHLQMKEVEMLSIRFTGRAAINYRCCELMNSCNHVMMFFNGLPQMFLYAVTKQPVCTITWQCIQLNEGDAPVPSDFVYITHTAPACVEWVGCEACVECGGCEPMTDIAQSNIACA